MDLRRHINVLWRFKWIIVGGVTLAILVACVSTFRLNVGGHGGLLQFRGTETFTSKSQLLVTQPGFFEGRAVVPSTTGDGASVGGDSGRLSSLAVIYSFYTMSQQVQALIPSHPKPKDIEAHAIPTGNSQFLPIVQLTTTASSAKGALDLNQQAIGALEKFLATHQSLTHTPDGERTEIQVLNPSSKPVGSGHPITLALVAFLLTVIASIALAYVLENLWPSWRVKADDLDGIVGDWEPEVDDEFFASPSSGGRAAHPSDTDT